MIFNPKKSRRVILRMMLEKRHTRLSGADFINDGGLFSLVLYPALTRLESRGEIVGEWEDLPPASDQPRRWLYLLTEKGEAAARALQSKG